MITPMEAASYRDSNRRKAADRLERAVDDELKSNDRLEWPVFETTAEDFEPEEVLLLIRRYQQKGWRLWYKPGGFLWLAPGDCPIDDTKYPHASMGSRYDPINSSECFHTFRGGYGMMGDALTCTKCDRSKYPEAMSRWDRFCAWWNGISK